jgi:hypothetical protein
MMKSKKNFSAFEIESSDLVFFEGDFSSTMEHGAGFSTIGEGCSWIFDGLFPNF